MRPLGLHKTHSKTHGDWCSICCAMTTKQAKHLISRCSVHPYDVKLQRLGRQFDRWRDSLSEPNMTMADARAEVERELQTEQAIFEENMRLESLFDDWSSEGDTNWAER